MFKSPEADKLAAVTAPTMAALAAAIDDAAVTAPDTKSVLLSCARSCMIISEEAERVVALTEDCAAAPMTVPSIVPPLRSKVVKIPPSAQVRPAAVQLEPNEKLAPSAEMLSKAMLPTFVTFASPIEAPSLKTAAPLTCNSFLSSARPTTLRVLEPDSETAVTLREASDSVDPAILRRPELVISTVPSCSSVPDIVLGPN